MLTLYRSCYADVVTTEQDEGSYDQVKIAMEFSLDNIPKFIVRGENFLKLGPDTSSPRSAPHMRRRGACFVWSSACSRSRPREGRHLGCPAEPTVLPPSDHSCLKSAWRCRLSAGRVGPRPCSCARLRAELREGRSLNLTRGGGLSCVSRGTLTVSQDFFPLLAVLLQPRGRICVDGPAASARQALCGSANSVLRNFCVTNHNLFLVSTFIFRETLLAISFAYGAF